VLRETAPGWMAEEVHRHTGARLIARGRVPEMRFA